MQLYLLNEHTRNRVIGRRPRACLEEHFVRLGTKSKNNDGFLLCNRVAVYKQIYFDIFKRWVNFNNLFGYKGNALLVKPIG